MRNFGITSTAPPMRSMRSSAAHDVHGSHVRDSLAAVAVALVGIGAFAFVLIVLPWVISI